MSVEKDLKHAYLAEKEERNKWKDLQDRAERQLYDEGKIGFCGTDKDFRAKSQMINSMAQEMQERDEYKRLKEKYG